MIVRFRLISILALLPAAAACGKKGPPLAPIRIGPAQVEELAVRRFGSDVYVQFTIPSKNQDSSTPADVTDVRVYGLTLAPETRQPEPPPLEIRELIKLADEVGRVEVQPPPIEVEKRDDARDAKDPEARKRAEEAEAAKRAAAEKAAADDPRPAQGARVTIVEKLTPETLVPVERPIKGRRRRTQPAERQDEATIVRPLFTPVPAAAQTRTYVVVGFNRKGQEGLPSARIQVPLAEPPPAPPAPRLSYTESGITVAWQRPQGLRRPAHGWQEPGWDEVRPPDGPIEPPPQHGVPAWVLLGPGPLLSAKPIFADTTPAAYNVYEVPSEAKPEAGPATAAALDMPKPLNATPLEATKYEDARVEFEKERCFAVRTVETHGDLKIESESSPRACLTPRDVFPPPAPTNLAAVASEGGISLIWEGSQAADLAGYLVLRAEAPSGVPKPVTAEPVKETTLRDTTVKPGTRYIYVVVAVDTATPPNMSGQSNRVEETAR